MRTTIVNLDGCATVFGICDQCKTPVQTYKMWAVGATGAICGPCKTGGNR